MKKIIFSAVAVAMAICTVATAQAQDFTYGVKVGVAMGNFSEGNDDSGFGLQVGVSGEYSLSDVSAISADIMYAQTGSDNLSASYLNIPILYNYKFAEGFAVKAGIQPGFLMGGDLKDWDGESFALAVPVGVSYDLECGIGFDLRYNFGLTEVVKDSEMVNNVLSFTVGYKF
ncbi:MAG: porin family protein [Rikenellaceae bacterium]